LPANVEAPEPVKEPLRLEGLGRGQAASTLEALAGGEDCPLDDRRSGQPVDVPAGDHALALDLAPLRLADDRPGHPLPLLGRLALRQAGDHSIAKALERRPHRESRWSHHQLEQRSESLARERSGVHAGADVARGHVAGDGDLLSRGVAEHTLPAEWLRELMGPARDAA